MMGMTLESYVGNWQGSLAEPVRVFTSKPYFSAEDYIEFKTWFEKGVLEEKLQSEKGWGPRTGGKGWYYTAGVMEFFEKGLHNKD